MTTIETAQSTSLYSQSSLDSLPIGVDDLVRAQALLDGSSEFLPGRQFRIALQTPLVFSDALTRQSENLVVIVSGGNIDPSFSWRILYEQTIPNLLAIRLAMPDRPGELLRMLMPIAQANVNIIDVDVDRLDARPRMGERIVELCVAISGQSQADSLVSTLNARGYRVLVSRWQDPTVDRPGNVSRSPMLPDRIAGSNSGVLADE
ncbi:hypothetical protein BH24CHL4_BH24CHL4_06770 [soil metagenome]